MKTATCECPGGVEPAACKHSLALLYALESYSQRELYSAPTEQLQRWHQVKPQKVSPIEFSSQSKDSPDSSINFSALNDISFADPIFDVLSDSLFDIDDATYKKTLPLPLLAFTKITHESYPKNLTLDDVIFFHSNIMLSFEEAVALERQTFEQSDSETWKSNRQKRLTSSLFFQVCKSKNECNKNLAKNIFNPVDKSHIPAVRYGKLNEPLVQNVLRHKYKNFTFRKTGLVVNPFFFHLGASPDGLTS